MKRLWLFTLFLPVLLFGNELSDLLREALTANPGLAAQSAVCEQQLQQYRELAEFLDPSVYAAAGYGSQLRSLPIAPPAYSRVGVADSAEAAAGVLVPIEGGAYVSAGALSRRWFDPEVGFDPMYQHLLGINVQVPLLKDRGFAGYSLKRQAAEAALGAAQRQLMAMENDLRFAVEQAYITALEAKCNYAISKDATRRFERLDEEAQELSRLKTIPAYQRQETMRDLQTGREDEETARNLAELRLVELALAMGVETPRAELAVSAEEFLSASAELPESVSAEIAQALEETQQQEPVDSSSDWTAQAIAARHEVAMIAFQRRQAEAEYEQTLDAQKDSLNLDFGVTWQGDSNRGPLPQYRYHTEHNWGAEVRLTWTRPFGKTGDTARAARFQERLKELDAQRRVRSVSIAAEIKSAQLRYSSARRRLELVSTGIAAAEATLQAEQERFRLGEGSSNEVLDAQKNLTQIRQRLAAATGELLRAHSAFQYAVGYLVIDKR